MKKERDTSHTHTHTHTVGVCMCVWLCVLCISGVSHQSEWNCQVFIDTFVYLRLYPLLSLSASLSELTCILVPIINKFAWCQEKESLHLVILYDTKHVHCVAYRSVFILPGSADDGGSLPGTEVCAPARGTQVSQPSVQVSQFSLHTRWSSFLWLWVTMITIILVSYTACCQKSA